MRPLELEVEGFTAFRDRTTVDFRGADLFALSGPTGAGKSSVIDALTFALYGSVARYGDRDVLIIGTHFADPTAGRIKKVGDGCRFETVRG